MQVKIIKTTDGNYYLSINASKNRFNEPFMLQITESQYNDIANYVQSITSNNFF